MRRCVSNSGRNDESKREMIEFLWLGMFLVGIVLGVILKRRDK